jgi:hypothetical protein
MALLDPALDPRSPRGRMAMLVMSAAAVGRNIDRLARITQIERETVAKFCRRLFDADIDPAEIGTAHRDFWNVVGLAEGRLARRVDDMGRTEWVPVGRAMPAVEPDWPADAAPPVRRHGAAARENAAPENEETWAPLRGRAGAAANLGVPGLAAAPAVELFPGAEWLT